MEGSFVLPGDSSAGTGFVTNPVRRVPKNFLPKVTEGNPPSLAIENLSLNEGFFIAKSGGPEEHEVLPRANLYPPQPVLNL
ncbi:MAG: hypothetical protein UW80_C0001G0034 [Microgenomates group bacterium GW2011_GWC1_44_9]|nr:MAG: hypothetical protein UW80_C0001G0034 [Microgenomates group bacterium GW2011_GWC1_44_9]